MVEGRDILSAATDLATVESSGDGCSVLMGRVRRPRASAFRLAQGVLVWFSCVGNRFGSPTAGATGPSAAAFAMWFPSSEALGALAGVAVVGAALGGPGSRTGAGIANR